MELGHIWILLALLVPLTLDTFIVSAALALGGLPKQHRLRTSLVLTGFEAVMPAVGVLLGQGVADFAGDFAGYIAGAVIGVAGGLMLLPQKQSGKDQSKLVAQAQGLTIVNLGLSISIDELALGISLGLLHVPLLLTMLLIGLQAFLASQLGLRLGAKLNSRFREHAEQAAGAILLIIALVIVILQLTGVYF